GYETPRWRERLGNSVKPIFPGLHSSWQFNDTKERALANGSMQALINLGPKGEAELGELTKLLLATKGWESPTRATVVLTGFKQAGLQRPLAIMTNHPPPRVLPHLSI